MVMKETGVESSTASSTEHKNETERANSKYSITNSIKSF
jgi:hypothetical protein